MSSTIGRFAVIIALLAAVACSTPPWRESNASAFASALPTSPTEMAAADTSGVAPVFGTFGGGGTVKEPLSGPAIDGIVPEGEAVADQSQFQDGGSTILTVRVKNVNLPDGTVLEVTLDFTPVGSIVLSRSEGTLRSDLGHFGVSRDQVRVNNGDTTILVGGFFR